MLQSSRELGFDTLFQFVPTNANKSKHHLFLEFRKVTLQEVAEYKTCLTKGEVPWRTNPNNSTKTLATTPLSGCPFDVANLKDSKTFLRNSISTRLYSLVDPEVEESAYRPTYLMKIFQKKAGISPTVICNLAQSLEKMSLKNKPGENVSTYSTKVKDIATAVHGSMYCPPDLTFLTLKGYGDKPCACWNAFANITIIKYNGDVTDTNSWKTEILKLTAKYDAHEKADYWPASDSKQSAKEANKNTIALIASKVTEQVSASLTKSGTTVEANGGCCQRKCFRYGGDYLIKNCPQVENQTTQEPSTERNAGTINPKKVRPAPGKLHKKIFGDNEVRYWCNVCNRYTAFHYTIGHRVQGHSPVTITPPVEPGLSAPAPALAPAPAPVAAGNLALDPSGLNFGNPGLIFGGFCSKTKPPLPDFPHGGHHA